MPTSERSVKDLLPTPASITLLSDCAADDDTATPLVVVRLRNIEVVLQLTFT